MVAKQLKTLRERLGKSQQEVCNVLNIEQSTLANYENGKRLPKLDILIKIAKYYHVSTDYLLGLIDEKQPYEITAFPEQSTKLNENTRKNVFYWIEKTGLDDAKIAEMLGISEELLKSYCSSGNIPLDKLIRLSEICEVSIDCLLNRTSNTLAVNEDEEKLLLSYRALNPKSKTMALSRIYELEREESLVAAKDLFLNSQGKSMPSNGTEGDMKVS